MEILINTRQFFGILMFSRQPNDSVCSLRNCKTNLYHTHLLNPVIYRIRNDFTTQWFICQGGKDCLIGISFFRNWEKDLQQLSDLFFFKQIYQFIYRWEEGNEKHIFLLPCRVTERCFGKHFCSRETKMFRRANNANLFLFF